MTHHTMTLEGTKSNGYEIWVCRTCGRTLLICWQPWDKITLVEGDLNATHSGGKGGVEIGAVKVEQGDPLPPEFEDWLRGQG